MAKIAYSMAGEGRGHATRAKTIIDHLTKRQHQILVFAPEFAFQFLSRVYVDEHRVNVVRIPGLMFQYRNSKLNFLQTAFGTVDYLRLLPALVSRISRTLEQFSADLAITDFEPALPRAAVLAKVPWISIDHQHFLVASDFSSLPRHLQWKAWGMAQLVKQYYHKPDRMVVSSFYFPPLKAAYQNVIQTGVLLRDQVVFAQPEKQGHCVAYLRRFASPRILEALNGCGLEVRIYGLGTRPSAGNLQFRNISENQFLDDLRTCRALISNAGNQLVGEALYLGKPVFVFPEERNFEQEINARFLASSGGGDWCHTEQLSGKRLADFVSRLDDFSCRIPRQRLNGNNATLQVIETCLAGENVSPILESAEMVNL